VVALPPPAGAEERRPGRAVAAGVVEPSVDADARDLAPEVRSQLRSLSPPAAERVARHLVATGQLLNQDPGAALAQARAARAFGARLGVVREAVGVAAYRAGEWAEAIAELRTARRLTGDFSHLPLIADSERALGRPERALVLARAPEVAALPLAQRAEMRIVESGARRDLGQLDAALVALEGSDLDRSVTRPWSARLWYAYADTLLALGRDDQAREWFVSAASIDNDGVTDAAERLLELDGIVLVAEDDDEFDADEDELDADEDSVVASPANASDAAFGTEIGGRASGAGGDTPDER
jgi:tetratricopeptide (TPR) repeat protein